MIGSTLFWSTLLQDSEELITRGWEMVTKFQTKIIQTMLNGTGGFFIKGVGDELIFRFTSVKDALEATRKARGELDNLVKELKADAEHSRILEQHWKAENKIPPFRFIIHWAKDKVFFGLYDVRNRSKTQRGLRSANPAKLKGAVTRFPESPDLFGHHMNYAARCMSVVSDSAIFITDNALDELKSERADHISSRETNVERPIEKHLGWPIQVGGTKGIDESLIFRGFFENPASLKKGHNLDATVDAYKTKALVYLSKLDKQAAQNIFRAAEQSIRGGKEQPDPIQKLLPHVFLFFYTIGLSYSISMNKHGSTNANNKKAHQGEESVVIFRFESLDAEYLETLLLDKGGARKIFNEGKTESSPEDINSETRFIRTKEPEEANAIPTGKWCRRGLTLALPFFYAEIQPDDVSDIDRYARRTLSADVSRQSQTGVDSCDQIGVIELGRLWGKPSIYVLVNAEYYANTEYISKDLLKRLAMPYSSEKGSARGGLELKTWKCAAGKTMDLIRAG